MKILNIKILQNISLPLFLLLIISCNKNEDKILFLDRQKEPKYLPSKSNPTKFDQLIFSAIEAEKLCTEYTHRVNFTAGQKLKIMHLLSKVSTHVKHIVSHYNEILFIFTPVDMNESYDYLNGWAMISKAFIWQMEYAISNQNYDAACEWFLSTQQFGNILLKGDATHASLGLNIINESRRHMVNIIKRFNISQLNFLHTKLSTICKTGWNFSLTMDHEYLNIKNWIDTLEVAFFHKKMNYLNQILKNDSKEPIKYLNKLHKKNIVDQKNFFYKLRLEAEQEYEISLKNSKYPLALRSSYPTYPKKNRPWKRFSKHFFSGLKSLQPCFDQMEARTKLFTIYCMIYLNIKTNHLSLPDLSKVSKTITTDPYTGKDFIYYSEGVHFKLYSVGENLTDDGGISNETGTYPDLILM